MIVRIHRIQIKAMKKDNSFRYANLAVVIVTILLLVVKAFS